MKGFKDFVMRGNLVELAVAFIMATAFAAVVTTFTEIIIELVAKVGGAQNFDDFQPGGLLSVGPFLTALFAFLLMALVVYFFVVKPYEEAKARFARADEVDDAPDESVIVLREIRDALNRPI